MLIAFLECNRSIVGAAFAQVDYVADHNRVSLEATPNRAEQIQTAFGVNRMATNGRKITIVTCFSSGSHPAHFLGKINGLIVCSKGRQSHYKSHGECDDKGNQFFIVNLSSSCRLGLFLSISFHLNLSHPSSTPVMQRNRAHFSVSTLTKPAIGHMYLQPKLAVW